MPSPAAAAAFPDHMITALFLLQGLWGFFLVVLTWSIRRVLKDIEENTTATKKLGDSMTSLNLLLAGNYVTKGEHERLEERLRQNERILTELKTRDEYRDRIVGKLLEGQRHGD